MATDHFKKHKWQIDRIDWNFNFLFDDQPQVAELAERYVPIIKHPGLHKPVPSEWLHATVLRVGFLENFTENEMLSVIEKLQPALNVLKLPELKLGEKWWIWNGGPVLRLAPRKELLPVYDLLIEVLTEIVGKSRLPQGAWFKHGPKRLQFIPHVTLAYPKTYHKEFDLYRSLKSQPLKGVGVRAKKLSLIKQRVVDDYYAWEVVKETPIGQV